MIYPEVPPATERDHGVEFMHEGVHYVYVDGYEYSLPDEHRGCNPCPFVRGNDCLTQCRSAVPGRHPLALFIMPFTDWQLVQLAN